MSKFGILKNVIGAVAPTIGSALAGPLGGQAASVISQVLGCSPEPKAINQAIQAATPEPVSYTHLTLPTNREV